MSDALYEALGIDEKALIDPTEVAEIQRTLDFIKIDAAKIARGNDTEDTRELLKALRLVVKAFAKEATPELARKMVNARNAGEAIPFSTVDPETDKLRKQLEELQAAATTPAATTKALSGSPIDSIMEEIKAQVSGDTERANNLLLLFKQLSGLDKKEYKARADIMGRVAFASPDWNLVPAPGTGEMLPSILVAADLKVADLTKKVDTLTDDLNPLSSGSTAHRLAVTEKALTDEQNTALAGSLAHQLAAAEEELDPANTGSIGCRAGWYDYNVDPANTNGWAGKLAAIQQELTNEQNDKLATSLAGKLKQAEDDVRAAKKEKDDATKVLAPISKAAKAADTAMDRALAKLADNSFGWKRLVPQNVKDARDQIDAAKLALHQAQNPKTAP